MFTAGLSVLRSFLTSEIPPNKVMEVNIDNYTTRQILYREEGLMLYAPLESTIKKDKSQYEIILHKPCTESLSTAFSIFRTDDKEEGENKFVCYKDKIPIFTDISKEVNTVYGLQRLCDALNEQPGYTLAHLASHLGLHEAFRHIVVNSQLNSSDILSGMSPLQVAVRAGNLNTIKALMNSKCSLDHLDHQGNTVFHYAGSTNKEIILALTVKGATLIPSLNARNHVGHTPLHIACLTDKPDCVKALLLGGADVNISATHQDSLEGGITPGLVGHFLQDNPNVLSPQDMKFGGTPLHWSSSRPVIDALLNVQCNINARNFDNRTALHVMVLRNRLECVIALLSRHADPDLGDNDGNRPIHHAVKEGNVSIIQALIIFGANLDVLNNKGETARHTIKHDKDGRLLYLLHAVGASRCQSDMLDCTPCCKHDGTYDGIPPPPVSVPLNREILNQMLALAGKELATHKKLSNKKGRLLCLDGGGIRGLVLIQMLLEIEKIIERPINNCFDWIAGTSTGGILALGLATGKTLQECLCLYFRMKEVTFVGLRPYPSEPLETVLKEIFGTNTVLTDIENPKLLITGVLADRKPVDLHIFRNYPSPSEILGIRDPTAQPELQLLWHIGRATGAAPTYFRAFGKYLDGGLISNNPTLDALTEIHELNLALAAVGKVNEITDVSVVVSLGTGLVPVSELKVDVYRPESIWDSAKLVIGISALGSLLVDQATATDGSVVDRARAWCSSIGVPYYRFTPQMSEEIAMDEKSDEKLVKILWESKVYIHENFALIQEVGQQLANEK